MTFVFSVAKDIRGRETMTLNKVHVRTKQNIKRKKRKKINNINEGRPVLSMLF